jgi:hypothetical protein
MKKLLFCAGLLIASATVTFAQSANGFSATRTEIKKGSSVLATYTRAESRGTDDKVTMVMTFIGTDGATIATATIPYQQKGAKTVIKTAKDNKEQTIILKGGMDTDMATEIATQLSETKYL